MLINWTFYEKKKIWKWKRIQGAIVAKLGVSVWMPLNGDTSTISNSFITPDYTIFDLQDLLKLLDNDHQKIGNRWNNPAVDRLSELDLHNGDSTGVWHFFCFRILKTLLTLCITQIWKTKDCEKGRKNNILKMYLFSLINRVIDVFLIEMDLSINEKELFS